MTRTGVPIMRPLIMEYQGDSNVENLFDEFLFGESLLIAPIVQPYKKARSVYLPQGEWVDYWTGEVICGGKNILKEADLDIVPIYVKCGAIIPMTKPQQYVGENEEDSLILHIYSGDSGEYELYEDDGISVNSEYTITKFILKNEAIEIERRGSYVPKREKIKIVYHKNGGIKEFEAEAGSERIELA
jgi:alpha-glucosidase